MSLNAYSSELLKAVPKIIHAFGQADPQIPPGFESLWPTRAKKKQIHSNQLAHLQTPAQDCGDVDGIYVTKPDLLAAVITADCIPVLAAKKDGTAVAAIHAGWRGLDCWILRSFKDRIVGESQNPQDWLLALGPSIGPCCYEVSEELVQQFQKQIQSIAPGIPQAQWNPTHRKIDLRRIATLQLEFLGFPINQIESVGPCTHCTPSLYSYRRVGSGLRQHSVIAIQS